MPPQSNPNWRHLEEYEQIKRKNRRRLVGALLLTTVVALLLALALVFLIAMLVLFFLPEPEGEDSSAPSGDGVTAPGEELDAFAGGYPVPPMPGQELPVSPRARRTRKAAEPARVDAASSIADAVTGSLAETVAGSVAISPPPSDSGSGDTAQEGTDD